jgi:hypothetical protein
MAEPDTMTVAAMDLDKAKLDPQTVFLAPHDVLGAAGLSPEDKKSILVRWEADVEALLRATEEGMPPADTRRSPAELLRAVHEAMESLERDTASVRCC